MKNSIILCMFIFIVGCSHNVKKSQLIPLPSKTVYRTEVVNGHKMFYREAGDKSKDTVLLLHGYPSSSHTFRELIPVLSSQYHVIAPDNLGSGFSAKPNPNKITYTFDLLANQIEGLLKKKNIKKFFVYMQDFGAPVGYRVILNDPSRVKGIIAQNANAYLDGLTKKRIEFFMTAGDEGSVYSDDRLFKIVTPKSIINTQYLRDIDKDKTYIMSPDSWTHDLAFLKTKQERKIQVQLFKDYRTNLNAYPVWQKYLREHNPPTLIAWGKKDPAFMAAGAEAYLRDVPNADFHLLDAGHFALEEKPYVIAELMLSFLKKHK